LGLVSASTGVYSGTWTPRATSSQVTITARVTAPGFATSSAQITGEVTANSAPLLVPGGTLHIYNPLVGAPVGPGTILQIYGTNLSATPQLATVVPLPRTLGGTSVLIGGIPAPLYYVGPNQINAQLPFELTDGQRYQIVVSSNGALTTPDSVQVVAATPGIAAEYGSGKIIAQHANYDLITAANPARPGEYIITYLAGLGATDYPVDDGATAPLDRLVRASQQPVLTLNGVVVPTYFAGLTPGLVGLYQINVLIPADTPEGDVKLAVSQGLNQSNVTILPVRKAP
jgi:uncharacterized protein (TIGR03437 family)